MGVSGGSDSPSPSWPPPLSAPAGVARIGPAIALPWMLDATTHTSYSTPFSNPSRLALVLVLPTYRHPFAPAFRYPTS